MRSTDYFEEWQKEGSEYNNPWIQQLSDQQRSILSGVYSIIAKWIIGVKDPFKTNASDITGIQMFLIIIAMVGLQYVVKIVGMIE